ncbi:CopD family protein [Gemmatimonas sp.]|uniref:CopD family protein n=1 Tax=Gemmatimonas sp. TaxID=1962908 RepID=UPI0035682B69
METFGVESPGYVVIRFLMYAGITIFFGSISLLRIILPRTAFVPAAGRDGVIDVRTAIAQRAMRWMGWSLIVLVVVTMLRLAAQHAAFFGSERWSQATMAPLLLQTVWGSGLLLAIATLAIAIAGWRAVQPPLVRWHTPGWVLLIASAGALAWSAAMSGHPAAADQQYVAMLVDALHVIGAGGWIGSLALMAGVAVPALRTTNGRADHDGIARLVAAFSPVALIFSAVLGATGIIASWRNIGTVNALWSSEYGLVLVRKLVVVAVVAGVGLYNWRWVLPRLGQPIGTSRLRRSATLELVAAGVVLAVTAVLVATSPP